MLTKLTIRNFKKFDEVEIELGSPVVFIGPNNSGKTSALQALALWEVGLRKWIEKRAGKETPSKRPGVTINRRDLMAVPVPSANLLWNDLHTRIVQREDGKQKTYNVYIEIVVEGADERETWECGLEFYYANEESLYCRPRGFSGIDDRKLIPVPPAAERVALAFLPPMSGLTANETRLDSGAINVRIGEGRTAEVLRNLCYQIFTQNSDNWGKLYHHIARLFGAELEPPKYLEERGEIVMTYKERGVRFDLSSSGRGLQQTLLLLAYMYQREGAILLLDEPDAHLEILRQRQIYQVLCDVSAENGNQVIAASHSEVLLNEAASRDVVVAFVGKPHRIDDRGAQLRKSLIEIGFEHYYQAEQKGWVLYLEGPTDLAILLALARKLGHQEAVDALEQPFVHYVENQPNEVRKHFFGLREARPSLRAFALFDRLDRLVPDEIAAFCHIWKRREIENYICTQQTLENYARRGLSLPSFGPLFDDVEGDERVSAMTEAISRVSRALQDLGRPSPWDLDCKVSDDFLTPLFKTYFLRLNLPNFMAKKNFHELAEFVSLDEIDGEVSTVLDRICRVADTHGP